MHCAKRSCTRAMYVTLWLAVVVPSLSPPRGSLCVRVGHYSLRTDTFASPLLAPPRAHQCAVLLPTTTTYQGFILTFSITNDTTMEDLKKIRDDVLKVHQNKQVPMLLVGNKCDLSSERAVTAGEAKRVAQEWGCEYIETSVSVVLWFDIQAEHTIQGLA